MGFHFGCSSAISFVNYLINAYNFSPRSCIDTHLNVNLSLMLSIALPELANRLEKQQADQNNSMLLSGAEI